MREIVPPQPIEHADLFLAGGITGAEDWQRRAIDLLEEEAGSLFNPRRPDEFKAEYAEPQIEWEHDALRNSEAILFWFPPQTLCPITLFELGVWSSQQLTPIFVGTHPDYQRRYDVVKQLSLSNPSVTVRDTIEDTVLDYQRWRDEERYGEMLRENFSSIP